MTMLISGAGSRIASKRSGATTSAALDFDEQAAPTNRTAAAVTASRQVADEDTRLTSSGRFGDGIANRRCHNPQARLRWTHVEALVGRQTDTAGVCARATFALSWQDESTVRGGS